MAIHSEQRSEPQSTHNIVLATGNPGKVAELTGLLAPLGWQITPQTELGVTDADETGLTFIENAILKARHACASTGKPALADDSGLAVHALGGAPGIYSARYAEMTNFDATAQHNENGEPLTSKPLTKDAANIATLLAALKGVPAEQRSAEFHCVLVLMQSANDPTPLICHGRWQGFITEQPAGSGGFGYDPIFWLPEHNCTSAELSKPMKQQLSHRAKALQLLVAELTAQQQGNAQLDGNSSS